MTAIVEMTEFQFALGTLASIVAIALLYALIAGPHKGPRLPPVPKPWPVIGNLLDLPKEDPSAQYAAWAREYGDS